MAWTDRIQEAAYTSPKSGTRITFDFEDVSVSFDKKTSAYEFPDAEGTYIQDLGPTGRRYPIRAIFWGTDYDLQADIFETVLREQGVGRLEHPKYGSVDVVPFGAITRRDDLKTAANQAIFELTFWETTGIVYPTTQTDPAEAVRAAVDAYNAAAADNFAEQTSLGTVSEQVTFKSTITALLNDAIEGLKSIANASSDTSSTFSDISDSINNGIDVLITEPRTMAAQMVLLIQSAAKSAIDVQTRVIAYRDQIDAILNGPEPTTANGGENAFIGSALYAATYTTGSIVSAVNAQFETKTDALTAAEEILLQFEEVNAWREAGFETIGEVDTGEAYQKLQAAAALTAGYLVSLSFSLKQERRFTLTRNRTPLDLAAELYGETDSALDFFISSNDLSGSEILEIQRGREIVYYV